MEVTNMLDIKAAARKLRISEQAMHALCDRGTVQFTWLGGRKFVRYGELMRLLDDPDYRRRRQAAKGQEEGLF